MSLFYKAFSPMLLSLLVMFLGSYDKMTDNEILKKVTFEAEDKYVTMIQQARAAGKRYGDKKYSNRLAYEIGVKVLMGLNDKEEIEAKKQRLEDLKIQQSLLSSEERILLDDISRLEGEEKQKEEEALKVSEDIQKLAARIKEYWVKIVYYDQKEFIGYLVTQFKISRAETEKAFEAIRDGEPTEEEALKIASKLMEV